MGVVTNLLGEALNSVIGNPKKALLIVFTGADAVFDSQKVADAAANALGNSAKQVLGSMTSQLGGGEAAKAYHVLEVQYNPAAIQLQANAEPVPFQYLQQNLDSGIPTQLQRPPSVVLSVELFFDDMNLADSFMWEKFTAGVSTQTASNIAAGVQKGAGRVWSVQAQTNGLLATLLRDSTRTVTFKWADMTFTGELTEAQGRYTMFSTSGRPVRSIVRLNITQQVRSEADIQYWNKALDKVFEQERLGGNELSAVSNLISLSV